MTREFLILRRNDKFYIENAAAADTASGAKSLADGRAFFDEMG